MTSAAFGTQRCADKSNILDSPRNLLRAEPKRHRGGANGGQPRNENRIGAEDDEKIVERNGASWPAWAAGRCQSPTGKHHGRSVRSGQNRHDDREAFLHGEDEINHLHDGTTCGHDDEGRAPSGAPGGDRLSLAAPGPQCGNAGKQGEIDLYRFRKLAPKHMDIRLLDEVQQCAGDQASCKTTKMDTPVNP